MKSTIVRVILEKGFFLGDYGTYSKSVSGGKEALLKKLIFFIRPSEHCVHAIIARGARVFSARSIEPPCRMYTYETPHSDNFNQLNFFHFNFLLYCIIRSLKTTIFKLIAFLDL